MDKTDRETHDFMNVSSFSQLPFIRPAVPPPRDKAGGAIRLFGKEFGGSDHHSNESSRYAQQEADANNNMDSSRKFECHYCCRNFPTSQALGGHQNAHKRERQHAKRAHLQSTMLSEANVCGIMNYSRMGSSPGLPIAYHSWNSNSSSSSHYGANSSRLCGSQSPYNAHQRQPINGSPLALWQIPVAHSSSIAFNTERVPSSSMPMHQQVPLLNFKEDHVKPISSMSRGLTSQSQFGYNSKPGKQDLVSLDLHL